MMLEETGTKVSISKLKLQATQQGSSHCSKTAKKKKKARLHFATAHGDKDHFLEKCPLV